MWRKAFWLFFIAMIVLGGLGRQAFCIDPSEIEILKDKPRDHLDPEVRRGALDVLEGRSDASAEFYEFLNSADGMTFLLEIIRSNPDYSIKDKAMDQLRYCWLYDEGLKILKIRTRS